ncbi:MAG: extracellular solute-binding protein [Clostridia bacterium]|jgi:ABC-type glycerol-3-phosphate transport system substrate-binding protein|nr:extracellular solute-binding protein [Clostridia bacterium]
MKKRFMGMAATALSALMIAPLFAACGQGGDDIDFDENGNVIPSDKTTIINFWGWADKYEEAVFNKLVSNFNEKYSGVIKVNYTPKSSSGYSDNFVVNMIGGPDIAYADERYFKSYADQGVLYDVSEFYKESVKNYFTSEGKNGLDEADMLPYTTDRYRYDPVTTTSEQTDPLYGLAKDLAPTAIYFNTKFFQNAGITVISETEESIRDYNEAHPTAKKKIKAYYEENGSYYFNKSIAMSWQECVDLSRKLQTEGGADYGFFSEWWFNYGFTVGGDCIEYVPTNDPAFNGGYWEFTLADEEKNYIVKDGGQPIAVGGNTYSAGQIVEYNDKKLLTAEQKEQCNVLPSQREAFTEFVRLSQGTDQLVDTVSIENFYGAGEGGKLYGYGITPDPNSMSENKNAYFSSGKVAMLVSTASVQRQFTENMRGENKFDVCPMLVYKEYSADGTEVLVHGVEGAHSGSVGIVMNANTKNPNAAWLFMEYIASKEGQEIQASGGFAVPYYKSLAYAQDGVFLKSDYAAENAIVFAKATAYETPGDWWYLKDKKWIDDWARVLNSDVRNGKKSLTQFYESAEYKNTQKLLNAYTAKK